MIIRIVSSKGEGKTTLAAFDNALKNAGVYNYNLIVLSSVIPPKTKVVKLKKAVVEGEVGDRLYVVMSEVRSDTAKDVIGASIGWYIFKNGGVFVEHRITGKSKKQVEKDIRTKVELSLRDLCKFRNETFKKEKMGCTVSICKVDKDPSCALSIAVYKAEPW